MTPTFKKSANSLFWKTRVALPLHVASRLKGLRLSHLREHALYQDGIGISAAWP
jgi:hypothetical protein